MSTAKLVQPIGKALKGGKMAIDRGFFNTTARETTGLPDTNTMKQPIKSGKPGAPAASRGHAGQ